MRVILEKMNRLIQSWTLGWTMIVFKPFGIVQNPPHIRNGGRVEILLIVNTLTHRFETYCSGQQRGEGYSQRLLSYIRSLKWGLDEANATCLPDHSSWVHRTHWKTIYDVYSVALGWETKCNYLRFQRREIYAATSLSNGICWKLLKRRVAKVCIRSEWHSNRLSATSEIARIRPTWYTMWL